MTSNEEEEEGQTSTGHGRPNLWWKQQREAQERDVFKGEYTSIRHPKAGQQTVQPEDTLGQYGLCWCGEPMDHDWPGKDKGRKHPRKVEQMSSAAVEEPHITRKELNHFDEKAVEVIFMAVNAYGVRYRQTRSGIILYPKDGSEPYTIHRNATPRSIKAAQVWFVKHVIELDKISESGLVKDKKSAADLAADTLIEKGMAALNRVSEDDLRRLAAEKNSPEHQVLEPPVRPVAGKDGGVAQSTEDQAKELREAVRRRQHRKLPTDYPINPDETWGPMYRRHNGTVVEGFERFGETERTRCTRCEWEGTAKSVSRHQLKHDPKRQEGLWGSRAQDKKRRTIATTILSKRVREALDILHEAIGYQAEVDPKEMDALRARITALEVERDDLQARLDLMREALRA